MQKIFLALFALSTFAHADYHDDVRAIRKMSGCYLVDYSFTETESLKPGYEIDRRVYDVNKNKAVKEWISFERTGQNAYRLQHVLFATNNEGDLMEGSLLKHQAEDWEYEPRFIYDFEGPLVWRVRRGGVQGQWVRKITNLDDGLRHQCAASWLKKSDRAEWTCENYSAIPGRESRDMGRRDYNTLKRKTKLVVYGSSFLERQDNVKTIHENGTQTPLAKETGKNWFVRLPDRECEPAIRYQNQRRWIWNVLRETWANVLNGQSDFIEQIPAGAPPRFVRMNEIEEQYLNRSSASSQVRSQLRRDFEAVISRYRAPQ